MTVEMIWHTRPESFDSSSAVRGVSPRCSFLTVNAKNKSRHRCPRRAAPDRSMAADWFSRGKLEPSSCLPALRRLGDFVVDGGELSVEERLDVRPDLVGFCPGERLQHAFTPGGERETE